ncbi:MAG: CHAT domain-containing protein [Bacteroidia bacterium]|nr:CHAT domain-containing protein [Bacteroidia bacterium]
MKKRGLFSRYFLFVFFLSAQGFLQAQTDSLKASFYKVSGDSLLEDSHIDSARVYFQKAIATSANSPQWPVSVEAYLGIIACFYYKNELDSMGKYLAKAEKIVSQNEQLHRENLLIIYNLFSAMCLQQGNMELGLEKIKQGLRLRPDDHLRFHFLQLGAEAYRAIGDYENAKTYAESGINMADSIDTISSLASFNMNNTLASVYYWLGFYPEAWKIFQKNLQMINNDRSKFTPDARIQTLNGLALCSLELGKKENARTYLSEAQNLHKQNPNDQESTLYNLGLVYVENQQWDSAQACFLGAIRRSKQTGDAINQAKQYRQLGRIAHKKHNNALGLFYFEKSIGVLSEKDFQLDGKKTPLLSGIKSYKEMLFVCWEKAKLLQEMGADSSSQSIYYLKSSFATYQFCTTLLDTMRTIYQEDSKKFWNEQVRPLYENAVSTTVHLYQRTGKDEYLNAAFRFAEKSRAALLAEAVRESLARESLGVPKEVLDREKELKILMAYYREQIFREKLKEAEKNEKYILFLEQKIFSHRQQYDLLMDMINADYPKYFRIKYDNHTADIPSVQRSLKNGEAWVEYVFTESSIFVFCITPTKAQVEVLPLPSNFKDTFSDFIARLNNREEIMANGFNRDFFKNFTDNSYQLFELLLKPVYQDDFTQITLVTDGILGYLPFELLLLSSPPPTPQVDYGSLNYLLKKVCVRYEYSATLAGEKGYSRKTNPQFAGYAPVYSDKNPQANRSNPLTCEKPKSSDFGPLTHNMAEVENAARILAGKVYSGGAVSENSFKNRTDHARIIHFAMHGFLNDCDPMYSGLVFSATGDSSEDGFLHAYEIYNLNLRADLAVLSACNTGKGQLNKGEGIMSLARAFRYAGCPNVLMSLWQAEDEATMEIMSGFYQYLDKGKGKAEALRLSRLDYIESGKKNHPFFWASFVLIGNNEPIKQRFRWEAYGFMAILLIGIIFGGIYYRKAFSQSGKFIPGSEN